MIRPADWWLHCPPMGWPLQGRWWLTRPDGDGRLTEPAVLAAAFGRGGYRLSGGNQMTTTEAGTPTLGELLIASSREGRDRAAAQALAEEETSSLWTA
ncbi:hypothetical protein GCM10022295_83180 [Streptomyces osmaniensis]|uniref:Uncharacterized protein n=1 Tax=Streptomyces osmaniensis TaxID=593134 RepID=A0ABP6YQY3_9ACTN